jgi:hypothetical protein
MYVNDRFRREEELRKCRVVHEGYVRVKADGSDLGISKAEYLSFFIKRGQIHANIQ